MPSRGLTDPRRVSFASGVTILGGRPPLEQSPDILIHDPFCADVTEEDEMDILGAEPDVPIAVLRPPPGFRQFSSPREEWGPDVDPPLFNFSKELPGWFPWGEIGDSRLIRQRCRFRQSFRIAWTTRLLPMWVRPGKSRTLRYRQPLMDALPVGMDSGPDVLADSSSPDAHGPFSGSPVEVVAGLANYLTGRVGRSSPGLVPRWRLVREGPFLAQRSSSSLRCFGAGCAFRNTTYRPSDYASPSDEFGITLHHSRFLEWIGVPESAGLWEMGQGRWLH